MSIGKSGVLVELISPDTFPRSSSDSVNAFLSYHYLLCFYVAHYATSFACVLQTVRHLPFLALELLLNLQHHRGANPCTVALNTLVLTTAAKFLYLTAVSVSNAFDKNLLHILNFQLHHRDTESQSFS